MKIYNIIYLILLIVFGCDSNSSNLSEISGEKFHNQSINDKNNLNIDSNPIVMHKNVLDKNNLKQGIWEIRQNGKIKGIESYRNDTLNGFYQSWINYPGQIIQGNYAEGKKFGIWKSFENDTNLVMVSLYKENIEIWSGFPLADADFPIPIKGFNIYVDSVLIECPYSNDTIWYTGRYIKKKPVGIHKMFNKKGRLKFEHNYFTSKLRRYDKKGNLIKEETYYP